MRSQYGLTAPDASFTLITQNIDELSTRALDDILKASNDVASAIDTIVQLKVEVDEAKTIVAVAQFNYCCISVNHMPVNW
jgi:NAD-dependent SIR2 family protein deacetylase